MLGEIKGSIRNDNWHVFPFLCVLFMYFFTVHCLLMAIASAQQPSLCNRRGIREVSYEQYFMQIDCLSFFFRFAQFFLCPLFNSDATDREVNAVDSGSEIILYWIMQIPMLAKLIAVNNLLFEITSISRWVLENLFHTATIKSAQTFWFYWRQDQLTQYKTMISFW